MSKLCLVERNKKRIKLYSKYKAKHDKLLKQANNKKLTPEERFQARLKLSKIPETPLKVVLEIDVFSPEEAEEYIENLNSQELLFES